MKHIAKNPSTPRSLLIMAGGTGGHVFPALAVARMMRDKGWTVTWMGTAQRMEAKIVPAQGIPIDYISIEGLRGRGKLSLLLAPFKLLKATWQAWRILLARRPAVVLGMGGFASGPGGLAAWIGNVPLLIHEQNAIPGMTNRFLSKIATCVCISFPDTLPGCDAVLTGNPVRADILDLPIPAVRYLERKLPLRILVLGGSLGAQALNAIVPLVVKTLDLEHRPEIWHQSGDKHFNETQRLYDEAHVKAQIVPFIEDMNQAYLWADYVICRAGAMTIAELTAVGLPAILVPYPHAVDDHQTNNAQLMVDAGAAVLIQQKDLTPASLMKAMQAFSTIEHCVTAAQKARAVAKPKATEAVAALCEELAGD